MRTLKHVMLLLLALNCAVVSFAQNNKELLFSGEFTFTYAEKVKIKAGGAIADKTRKELQSGTKVGDVAIDAATYKRMENETGTHFRIEIKKNGKGNFREVTLINMHNKQAITGLYDITTREMLFASAKGRKLGTDCGSIGMGVIKGKLSTDMKRIEGGEFAVGFIAGCKPVVIGASATFYYNGTIRQETVSTSSTTAETNTLWSSVGDTAWIRSTLLSCRWRPLTYIHNKEKINTKPEDFGHFYSNGFYECALQSMYDKGTWNYNGITNTITLALTGSEVTYVIDEITDTTLHCSSFNDECYLVKYRYKDVPPTPRTLSNNTNLLATTWKIQSHKKGLLTLKHGENDFIRIHHDGRYEQVLSSVYKTGWWHLTDMDKKITVNCSGTSLWEIKSISDKQVVLARPGEDMTIVKK